MRPSARAIVFTSEESWSAAGVATRIPSGAMAERRAHIVLADPVGAQVDREAGGLAGIRARVGFAVQSAQERAQEQDRANHGRRRIAGQAEDAHGPEPSVHQRLAGTHGDAPEAELHPRRDKRLLHEVVVADRRAAERHQHVDFGVAGAAYRRFHRADFIDRDAKIDRDAAARLDNAGDGEIVGGDDLRRSERPAGRDQFVAGRKNRDPGAAADRERRMVRRGRQRDISGAQPPARAG